MTRKASIHNGPLGLRVVCVETIAAGERLFGITGRPVARADRHSIQLGPHLHLTPHGAPWSLVNHSCSPNLAIDFDEWELVATRSIARGEELGWNYLTTEWELSAPFACACATQGCEQTIRGFKFLPVERRSSLHGLVSPYLRRRVLHPTPPWPTSQAPADAAPRCSGPSGSRATR